MSLWPYIEVGGAIFLIFVATTIIIPEVGHYTGLDISTFNAGLAVVGVALACGLFMALLER